MTAAEALREATTRLAPVSDTARLDAELLMAHAAQVPRPELFLRLLMDGDPPPPSFAALIERRLAHEPVAYILGHQEFYGRSFRVSPEVLIPRADSETVVEAALEAKPDAALILDCGVGSGALLLTCLLEIGGSRGVGIDRSPGALMVAHSNAQQLGLTRKQARFVGADWDQPGWADGLGQFDLILANPPYVETAAELAQQVRNYEPSGALFAGEDGLDAYRVLVPQLPKLLQEGGVAVLEIGAAQADAVAQLALANGFTADLRRDLGNRPRALVLRLGLGKGGASG